MLIQNVKGVTNPLIGFLIIVPFISSEYISSRSSLFAKVTIWWVAIYKGLMLEIFSISGF